MSYKEKYDIGKAEEYLAPVVRYIARVKDAYERVRNTLEKMICI